MKHIHNDLNFLGAVYTTMVLGSSMLIKRPAAGYIPAGYTPPPAAADGTGMANFKHLNTSVLYVVALG